jgi:hypothetical protein
LRQAFVTADEQLMLGRYVTSVKALLKLLAQQKSGGGGNGPTIQVESDLPIGGVMRNPHTGEIVRKG